MGPPLIGSSFKCLPKSAKPYIDTACNKDFVGTCGSALYPDPSGLTCQCEVFGCTCRLLLSEVVGKLSYPDVHVTDSTAYNVWGTVEYSSLFCSDDDYSATPDTTWSNGRGVCLITEITATVRTPEGDIKATSYTSSGTSYSKFAVIVDASGG